MTVAIDRRLLTKIMNRTEITKYLTNPELVANASSTELRRLVEIYPYCESLHWIYLRSLYINDDAIFEDELMKYGMHISNRRLFYNYLTSTNIPINETIPNNEKANVVTTDTPNSSLLIPHLSTPDYFSLEQNPEHKQSLQQLAAQLKAARLARQAPPKAEKNEKQNTSDKSDSPTSQTSPTTPTNPSNTTNNPHFSEEISEENAKKLIKEQKYSEAIEILRAISLNNPKKSANFALQIKFLETIINNHNKK